MAFGEHAGELVADAFAADLGDSRGELADGALGFRLDGVVEARGKADGAEHPQLVFLEAAVGLADGADNAGAEIVLAADVVENGRGEVAGLAVQHGIEHHAVDGEVAAQDVFLHARGKTDFGGMAAIVVGDIRAKCSNFGDNFRELAFAGDVFTDENDTEVGSDGEGAGKKLEDGVGMGAGGDVEVFGRQAEEQVADAAASEIRFVASGAEPEDDAFGGDLCGSGLHWVIQGAKAPIFLWTFFGTTKVVP